MNDVPVTRLTGRAAHFMRLLRDVGHLDEEAVTAILLQASQLCTEQGEERIDIEAVRRVSAVTLFAMHGGAKPAGVLSEDWPMLFS